jgi:hypothetical protein
MFDGFYKDDKIFALLRYVVPVFLILMYSVKYNVFKRIELIFIFLIGYILLLWFLNPGDEIVTAKNVLPVMITLLMIPIGRHLGKREDIISKFEFYNRILLIAIPLYILYANKVGIPGFYSEAFSTGFLITSRMYIVPIIIFFAIHYSLTIKNKSWLIKLIDILFIVFNICIILINTRRTCILMLVAAILIYLIYNRRLFVKAFMLFIVLVATLVLSYPLYEAKLTAQLERRERIESLDTYEEEGRYLETFYILDYHKENKDLAALLFGVQLFDTYDFGIKYFGRDRPIHSDINMIFFSTGIVGLLLFISFFYLYFFKRNRFILGFNKKLYYPLLVMFLIVLIPGRFIGTLTYSPLLMLLLAALKFSDLYATEQVEEENLALYQLQ